MLIGDLNAHIQVWYSVKTDTSGKLLEHMARSCNLTIVRSNEPTFCRPGKLSCLDYVLLDNRITHSLVEHRVADKLLSGSDHYMIVAHFTKNTLTLPCRQTSTPTIPRIPVHRLKNPILLARYKERLAANWQAIKNRQYTNTADRYKDYQ